MPSTPRDCCSGWVQVALILLSIIFLPAIELGCASNEANPSQPEDGDGESDAEGDGEGVEDLSCRSGETRCRDKGTLLSCDDDLDWEASDCRGDELCREGSCIPWFEAELAVDFKAEAAGDDPRSFTFTIDEQGLPDEAMIISRRFDFGDGTVGHASPLIRRYEKPGVYAVRLEVLLEHCITLKAERLVAISPLPKDFNRLILTVNELPEYLNGSQSYESDSFTPGDSSDDYESPITLILPSWGFDIDLIFLDPDSNDITRFEISADAALGGLPAGTDLADRFTRSGHRARWTVEQSAAFPDGLITLEARFTDSDNRIHRRSLSFYTLAMNGDLDPMDSPEVWLLDFERDHFTIKGCIDSNGYIHIDATAGADGQADFDQELTALGLLPEASAAGVGPYLRHHLRSRVRRSVARHLGVCIDGEKTSGGIDLRLYLDGEPGRPDPADFVRDGAFSMLGFGGELNGFFGMGEWDHHNKWRSDLRQEGRGIGSATVLETLGGTPIVTEAFDPIKPGLGIAVGSHPDDPRIFSANFDRFDPANSAEAMQRYNDVDGAIELSAGLLGLIAAHEIGHSVGLLPYDAPPDGFFAGRDDVQFIGPLTDFSNHADFPGPNLMQRGGGLDVVAGMFGDIGKVLFVPESDDTLSTISIVIDETRPCPYGRAYLQRKLLYLADTGLRPPGVEPGWSPPNTACVESRELDEDCDALPESCYMTALDATGLTIAAWTDRACDESPDSGCSDYGYDSAGRRLTQRIDTKCDGTGDQCDVFEYDPEGNLKTVLLDYDCNDTIDSCRTYTNDAEARTQIESLDSGCDGSPETCIRTTYDESDRPIYQEMDIDCEGFDPADLCTTTSYDARGNRLEEQADMLCDGSADYYCHRWKYDYDADGRALHIELDSDCDGQANSCIDRSYDDKGRLATEDSDHDCDQSPDTCRRYRSSCELHCRR